MENTVFGALLQPFIQLGKVDKLIFSANHFLGLVLLVMVLL